MISKPLSWVFAAVLLALAIVIAIVFDSPTSVYLLVIIALLGLSLSYMGTRSGR